VKQGELGTVSNIAVAKIPMDTFKLSDGAIYYDQGVQEAALTSSRFYKDFVFLIFNQSIIKTFWTSVGKTTGLITTKKIIYFLYPYGKYFISLGTTADSVSPAVTIFKFQNYKLT